MLQQLLAIHLDEGRVVIANRQDAQGQVFASGAEIEAEGRHRFRDQLDSAQDVIVGAESVSYTHLDVYKRQARPCLAAILVDNGTRRRNWHVDRTEHTVLRQ